MSDWKPRRTALAVGAVAALLDVVTKSWAFRAIPLETSVPVAGDWLLFHTRYNRGLPWSLGAGRLPTEIMRFLLPAVSVLAVVVLAAILRKTDPRDRLKSWGLALILGGAAGNLWDRGWTALDASHGGVRDFILLPNIVFGNPFPAFNLADAWITVGVAFVGWRILFEKEPAPCDGPPAPADAPAKDAAEVRA